MAKGNFIEYVISDDPNKYPNGSEQDGYYYRKVTKVETEEQIVTAGTTPIEVIPSQGKLISKVNINPTPTEEKTVIPTTEDLIVAPVEGKQLSQVTVQGDANFIEENIAEGITMWGKTGTHQGGGVSGSYVWTKQGMSEDITEDTTGGTYILTTSDDSIYSSEIEYSTTAPIYNSSKRQWEFNNSIIITIVNSDDILPSISGNVYCRVTSEPNVWYLVTAFNKGSSSPYLKNMEYSKKITAVKDLTAKKYLTDKVEDTYPLDNWLNGYYYKRIITDPVIKNLGLSWIQSNITSGNFFYTNWTIFNNIYQTNGLWVAGSSNNNGLYYSTNGKTWTHSNITSGSFHFIDYFKGLWITANSQNFYYSTDGKTWDIGSEVGGYDVYKICASENIIVAVGPYSFWYSTDGKTWTRTAMNSYQYNIYQDNKIWITGEGSNGLYYSTDGKTWTQSNITTGTFYSFDKFNNVFIAGGSNGLYYSTDGKTWTKSDSTNDNTYSICHNENVLVAGGLNAIWYSTDGKTWARAISGSFESVYFSSNVFVAGSRSGNKGLYYSIDGQTWLQSDITTGNFGSFCYNNSILVAGGDNGIYYSQGITEDVDF